MIALLHQLEKEHSTFGLEIEISRAGTSLHPARLGPAGLPRVSLLPSTTNSAMNYDGTRRVSREARGRFREGLGVRFPGPARLQERRLSKLKIDKRGGSDCTEEQHGEHPTSSYESAEKSGPQKDINARQSVGLDLRPWTTVGDERRW